MSAGMRSAVKLQTPVGGENIYGFRAGDPCWMLGAEDTNGVPLERTLAEILEAGEKPTIRIDEPATQSLCTQWYRLVPLVRRGERCWCVVERGGPGENRLLVELQQAQPEATVRPISSEDARPASWNNLEPLSATDLETLEQLGPVSEPVLAKALASGRGGGRGEGMRERGGELRGQEAEAGPKKGAVPRKGRSCGTPGCALTDFHEGACSNARDLLPRQRRAVGADPAAVTARDHGAAGERRGGDEGTARGLRAEGRALRE